jgi:hypothetical protein
LLDQIGHPAVVVRVVHRARTGAGAGMCDVAVSHGVAAARTRRSQCGTDRGLVAVVSQRGEDLRWVIERSHRGTECVLFLVVVKPYQLRKRRANRLVELAATMVDKSCVWSWLPA